MAWYQKTFFEQFDGKSPACPACCLIGLQTGGKLRLLQSGCSDCSNFSFQMDVFWHFQKNKLEVINFCFFHWLSTEINIFLNSWSEMCDGV